MNVNGSLTEIKRKFNQGNKSRLTGFKKEGGRKLHHWFRLWNRSLVVEIFLDFLIKLNLPDAESIDEYL